jgi:hypothetical protein
MTPKAQDPFRSVLELVNGLFDSPASGEIKIPSVGGNGSAISFGRIVVSEEIVIHQPTKEKIEAELRKIWTSGFQGNVIMPRRLTDPFIIRTEDYRQPRPQYLTEARLR